MIYRGVELRIKKERAGYWRAYFFEPVFGTNVHFLWDTKAPWVEEYIKRVVGVDSRPGDLADAYCFGLTNTRGHQIVIAQMRKRRKPHTLWHEALHATLYILDFRGVPVTADNSETANYLQGFLVEMCEAAIKSTRKRKHK